MIVLLLLRRVKSGRKTCAVRIGERRRVLTVSAHDEGGIVATGPAAKLGDGTITTPLSWQV
jgi:hypothetical protein